MASDLVAVTADVGDESVCAPLKFTSKFDMAMAVYKKHFSSKALKRAFRKATTQDDFAAVPNTRSAVLLYTDFNFPPALISLLKRVLLSYKPNHLETAACNQGALGNSVHNANSVARKSITLYGVRVFKALTIVHEILRARQHVPRKDDRDELLWWFETVLHDLKYGKDGELGYGKLILAYITYLKCLLERESIAGILSSSSIRHSFSVHQNLALSNHTFRETLFLDIQAVGPLHTGAKVLSLQFVVNDALGFAEREQPLLERMRREFDQKHIVEEKEKVFEMRREEVRTFSKRCEGILQTCEESGDASGESLRS